MTLLRELTVNGGLAAGSTSALLDTYKSSSTVHEPMRVLADLAVVIADGGDALARLATRRDQDKLDPTVPSMPTRSAVSSRVIAGLRSGKNAELGAARKHHGPRG